MTKPLRIMVVEDEMTIALLIEDMLEDLGHSVVAMAMRLPQAIELAQTAQLDMAILDINLDGRMSFPVADVLVKRGVPFVFASGYGSAGVQAPYIGRLVMRKPFELNDLRKAIAKVA